MSISNINPVNCEAKTITFKGNENNNAPKHICETPDCDCNAKVSAENLQAYANIKPAEKKDAIAEAYEKAVKISDGSAILKPRMRKTFSKIEPNGDGTYNVTIRKLNSDSAETKVMTEIELLSDPNICAGLVHKNEDGTYNLTISKPNLSQEDFVKTMKENYMNFHP